MNSINPILPILPIPPIISINPAGTASSINPMIPLSRPYIDEEDIQGVVETLRSSFLSLGPKLKEFETSFARYIGTKYAIAVSNGTCGLHLCVKALQLEPGDEVITSPFSFIASSNSILYENAKPVFVDIDENTFNLDVTKIEEKITSRTKAILPVHIFGLPCDMEQIIAIAKKYNLKIIEDAAEAVGAEYNHKKVGGFGSSSVFAFYPNKQITTGEGGIICTNDEATYKLCKSWVNQGRADNDQWLLHERVGYNYRLDEMSCSLGITQLKKIEFILAKRAEVAWWYSQELGSISEIILPFDNGQIRSWFVYVIRLKSGKDRNKVSALLQARGISTKPYLPAIHLQPAYQQMGYTEKFPVCEMVSSSTLALPFYTSMSKEEVQKVGQALREVLREL